jgi:hypothetical protein
VQTFCPDGEASGDHFTRAKPKKESSLTLKLEKDRFEWDDIETGLGLRYPEIRPLCQQTLN